MVLDASEAMIFALLIWLGIVLFLLLGAFCAIAELALKREIGYRKWGFWKNCRFERKPQESVAGEISEAVSTTWRPLNVILVH